jgi:hypothetical protein
MNPQALKDLIKLEYAALRQEIMHIIDWRITFLSFVGTSGGVLLGVNAAIVPQPFRTFFYLAPLIIVFPAQFIYFDRLKMFGRIVAYCRILEKLILGELTVERYPGWENGLLQMRIRAATFDQLPDSKLSRSWSTGPMRSFLAVPLAIAFLSLALFSCGVLSLMLLEPLYVLSFVVFVPVGVFVIQLNNLVKEIYRGKYSFNSNAYYWGQIMGLSLKQLEDAKVIG